MSGKIWVLLKTNVNFRKTKWFYMLKYDNLTFLLYDIYDHIDFNFIIFFYMVYTLKENECILNINCKSWTNMNF